MEKNDNFFNFCIEKFAIFIYFPNIRENNPFFGSIEKMSDINSPIADVGRTVITIIIKKNRFN